MRSAIRWGLLLASGPVWAATLPYFSVLSEDAGAWPAILSSIGLERQPAGVSHVFVARTGAAASTEWVARVNGGAILILEGESSLAEMFGFRRGKDNVKVNSLLDVHRPALAIIWERGLELPVFDLPAGARVFARERWSKAPMMAGLRRGAGAVLWVSVPPGERGYERFPYLLNALCDLGLEPPFRSARLWAFFDSAYRSRVDLDYFAARWRKSGIAALHVAAWHFYDARPGTGRRISRRLIEACHRQGILVYAWLELPHVSEKFWNEHPEWREKTAVLQDAQLDWRKLMNLANRGLLPRRGGGCEQPDRTFRLGRRQPGRAVFRIAGGHGQRIALHPHERRCARPSSGGSAGSIRLSFSGVSQRRPDGPRFWISAAALALRMQDSGWRKWRKCAAPSRIWTWC